MPTSPRPPLVGRHDETGRLRTLLDTAQRGGGGVLVLRGEPGIGKSALLEHTAQIAAPRFRTLHGTGSEFEKELPFAGLHQLCVSVLPHLDRLPPDHRAVLRVAFGLAGGDPDPHRVGLATLELLATAAREQPVLCVIDDAHWLDTASARALVFLARRIAAEPVAMVFAIRAQSAEHRLDELPGLTLDGLSDTEARSLLTAEKATTLDTQVRERLLTEARGNPLALIELPKAGGFVPPSPSPLSQRIRRSFRTRFEGLPEPAQRLLVLAGADPTGDPQLLWAAAERSGIDLREAGPAAEASELVEFGTRVRFCHPLARSSVYWEAGSDRRRAAHRALAEVTDPATAPDRRAWHRAQSSAGPDEEVATELESAAARARARGGAAAAAAFLKRAATLSLDPGRRVERTLAAVRAALDAGEADTAADLLNSVDTDTLPTPRRAAVDLLRGELALLRGGEGVEDGPRLLLRAARRLAATDPELSRSYSVRALETALAIGRPAGVMDRVLEAVDPTPPTTRAPDLLDALGLLHNGRYGEGVPMIRRVLTGDAAAWTRYPGLASILSADLWDHGVHTAITAWMTDTGQRSGSLILTRLALSQTAISAVLTGDFRRATAAIAEEEAIADAVGDAPKMYPRVQLAAMRGRHKEAQALLADARHRGRGQLPANMHWATAVLHNGLGDYPVALDAAVRGARIGGLFLTGTLLPELVEAAARCGRGDLAADALRALTERTEPVDTPWAGGVLASTRALVTEAEADHREGIEQLERSPARPGLARSHLRYGEWLRRRNRRRDAREQLRTAHRMLSDLGLEAFAHRAADELRATGEVVGDRSERPIDRLTMQEIHVARQVAAGATSKEVAARLFLSPRTIDAHLRRIFRKLDITSRRQLRDLPELGEPREAVG
ncbi:AAA family ATPase [Nocardiopsis ganjiahuensis]|uniref:AAA family ATPase n=1 Tax=Nocardiopsis ganjiahuensis TaxID=239984 RepID=UPI000345EBE6|nr:LuxR family transcriptional regulator [Nocardiopsis ganjiahuensis]